MDSQFPDVMVDLETTGTRPENSAIIQISAVRFNYDEGTVDSANMFDRCLWMAPYRFWDEDTRQWWQGKNLKVYQQICARMEDPAIVMKDLSDWAQSNKSDLPVRFWGKPTSFDYSFMQSYFRQFDLPMPWHYRYGRDMNSYIAGLLNNPDHPTFEKEVPFAGDAHNALHDTLHQIKVLFTAKEQLHGSHNRD